MHTDQLAYFLHVAETGSINLAAQKFFMTQQAVNAQLKKLENEMDVPLFTRSNKGVTLTPQGRLFIPYAKKILQQHDEAIYELQRFDRTETNLVGTLSIFSASIFSDFFLPGVIREFTQLHPNTTIKIIEISSGELLSYLFNGYCEIALFSAGKEYIKNALANDANKNIKALSLLDDYLVLCARPDHPLMRYKRLTTESTTQFAEKEKFRFSLYQIVPLNMPEIVYADSISNSNNVELHKKLIWEGVAVTYMSKLAYQYKFQNDGLACVPVSDGKQINHCLLYQEYPQEMHTQLLHCFLKFLQKEFQRRFGMYMENSL